MRPLRASFVAGTIVRLALVGGAVGAAGCAAGNHHAYDQGNVFLYGRASGKVAVSVQDRRPAVLSGDKTPDFVGLQRGAFGNPFDVTTASGQPLAVDVSEVLCRSLKMIGHQVRCVSTERSQSYRDVVEDMMRTRAPRLVVVQIKEWSADSLMDTEVVYDLAVDVLDGTGVRLAHVSGHGRDKMGKDVLDPASHARETVPKAFWSKMTRLMNAEPIFRALSDPAAKTAPADAAAAATQAPGVDGGS